MSDNIVVKKLKEIANDKLVTTMQGSIENIATDECSVEHGKIGTVYGVAIKLTEKEKNEVYKELNEMLKDDANFDKWESIGDNWYPLYWGRDITMMSRLIAHTKDRKSTGTLQLNIKEYDVLSGKEVIWGTILCEDYKNVEIEIQSAFHYILKTRKSEE